MNFNRCYSCMGELPAPGAVCPRCGYDNTKDPQEQPGHVLPCGTVLNGKYITGRVLGQGGFGITYIGFDLSLEQPVCIKEYFPAGLAMRSGTQSGIVLWSSGENTQGLKKGRESFVREAQRAAKLRGLAHVVNVWEVFYENETAYITMEYIEGETLKDRLVRTQKPLGERECVELLTPVMEDLEKAHGLGIIHRDIKPDNIMLRENGEPVLLDMGAAKDLIRAEQNGTLSSTAVVSEGFSPLEQYSKKNKTGPYTDVYAMCATIYYCVTGKVLNPPTERVVEDDLDLSGFTAPFASVLEKGLAVRAHDRLQTMGELLTALGGDTREQDYQAAKTLFERGDRPSLLAAQRIFSALGGYRDAAALAERCKKRLEETEKESAGDSGGNSRKNSGGEKPKPKLLISLVAGALLLGAGYYIGTHRDNAPTPVQVITEIETPTPTPTPTPKPTPIPTPSGSPISEGKQGALSYAVYKDRVEITGCDKKAVTVQVPDAIEGKPVTSIGDWAFWNCTSLTSISLPESVTSIGGHAFSYCKALTSISLPEGVTSIGDWAFYGCTSLTSISLPESLTSIGRSTFSGCTSLTSISLPESLTSIGDFAFSGCTSLTSISLPESVRSIGGGAFYGCTSLTSISLPESVRSIGAWAFYGCTSLTSISLPESVRSIGDSAFRWCESLTSISLPESVRSIGDSAFHNCNSLKEIHVKAGSYAAEFFAGDARLVID